MECLSDEALAAWSSGDSEPDERSRWQQHANDCDRCQSLLAFGAQSQPGESQWTMGRYAIECTLGSGGLGVVFQAQDTLLQRRVALKLLHSTGDAENENHTRNALLAEARMLATVQHPNVVAVHDVGEIDDSVFLAMNLVSGTPLDRWLAGKSSEKRTYVLTQVAAGLQGIHAANVVHGDLKAANVVVTSNDTAIIVDLGLARRVDEQREQRYAVGTPGYWAPEIARGGPPSVAGDVFAFWRLVEIVMVDATLPAKKRAALDMAIARGTADDPCHRFVSAVDCKSEIMATLPSPDSSVGLRSRRTLYVAVAIAAVAVVGVIVVLSANRTQSAQPRGADCEAGIAAWDQAQNQTAVKKLQQAGIDAARFTTFLSDNHAAARAIAWRTCIAKTSGVTDAIAEQQRSCALTAWQRIAARSTQLLQAPGRAEHGALDTGITDTLWTVAVSMPVAACTQANPPSVAIPLTALQSELANKVATAAHDSSPSGALQALQPEIAAAKSKWIEGQWNLALVRRFRSQMPVDKQLKFIVSAQRIAAEIGDDELRAVAKIQEAALSSDESVQREAQVAVTRINSPMMSANLNAAYAESAFRTADFEAAVKRYASSTALFDQHGLGWSQSEVQARSNFGLALVLQGRDREAQQQQQLALAGANIVYGADYIANANILLRLALSYDEELEYENAERYVQMAKRLVDAHGAPDSALADLVQISTCQIRIAHSSADVIAICKDALQRAISHSGVHSPEAMQARTELARHLLVANDSAAALKLLSEVMQNDDQSNAGQSVYPRAIAVQAYAMNGQTQKARALAQKIMAPLRGMADTSSKHCVAKIAALFPDLGAAQPSAP
jgi:hypothetical protein